MSLRTTIVLLVALGGCSPAVTPTGLTPTLGHSQPVPIDPPVAESSPTNPAEAPTSSDRSADDPREPDDADPVEPSDDEDVEDVEWMPTPAEEALCRHITQVVRSESTDDAALTAEQLDELRLSCAFALAYERGKLGAAEFDRRAECIAAASSVAGFAACRP